MRKLAIILTFLLTLVGGWVPAASAQNVWDNLGGDPVATTRVGADARFPEFLKLSTIPEHIKARFLEEIQRNPEGKTVYLNPGDSLKEMAFGQKRMRIWKNVVVGTMRLERGVVKAVEAREWRVEDGDRVYTLVMPLVCYNWAWRVETPPRPLEVKTPDPECVELSVPSVHAGDPMTLKVRAEADNLPPSACWAYKKGSGAWIKWPECLTCFTAAGPMTFRIPLEVAKAYEIEICWLHGNKPSLKWVIVSSDWVNYRYEVPDLESIKPHPKGGGS